MTKSSSIKLRYRKYARAVAVKQIGGNKPEARNPTGSLWQNPECSNSGNEGSNKGKR